MMTVDESLVLHYDPKIRKYRYRMEKKLAPQIPVTLRARASTGKEILIDLSV